MNPFKKFIRYFLTIRLICPFLIGLLSFAMLMNCKSDSRPPGIPPEAQYDRKINLFSVIKDGYRLRYYKDGDLYEKCEVDGSGRRHGFCESFLQGSGERVIWGRFQEGQRVGEWIWTFEDGKVYIRQNFTYGKKRTFWIPVEEWGNEDGLYERFFPDGTLEEKGYFDGGYRSGDWVKYYTDKKLEYKGRYLSGKRVGSWIHYYPGGQKEAEEKFEEDGKLIYRRTFYPNGNIWCEKKGDEKAVCREP